MGNLITIQIKTLSNLFIGGAPAPFEIGGIDQRTAVDYEGFPCIPGSSLKGALRAIVREDSSDSAASIINLYTEYLKKEKEKNWKEIQVHIKEREAIQRIEERFEKAVAHVTPEYLFGIEGFNNTPKLFFNDLLLCDEFRNKNTCFSIDMKNTIDLGGAAPESNPRTYQTARRGMVFQGNIMLHNMDRLGEHADELCEKYIIDNILKFNEGIYRLGNSKSRGYGKIEAFIIK